MDETANHSGDLFTKDAYSCGRNLKKSFEKILIMNTFYVRLSLTWALLFQGPLLKYHEGTQNSCGKTKGAFQKSKLAGWTMARPTRHFGNEIVFFFPKGFAEKPFPLCIMFSISLIWVITF